MVSSRHHFLAAVFALIVAIGASTPASAHVTNSVEDHVEADLVQMTPKKERRISRESREAAHVDTADASAADAGADAGEVGSWGELIEWPVVAINMALLTDGKVLAYDSIDDDPTESHEDLEHVTTRAMIWDPATGEQIRVDAATGVNIFCSGMAHLMDGSIFVAGGNANQALHGSPATHVFDHTDDSWTKGDDMAVGRWYPSVTPLSNGEMLITEGDYWNTDPNGDVEPDAGIPEVRELDGSLRPLPGAKKTDLPLYPWIDVAPDGRAFVSGPDKFMWSMDTAGSGSLEYEDDRGDDAYRYYGGHVVYDIGKTLVAGGSMAGQPAYLPKMRTARTIDLNGDAPDMEGTGSMETGRRHLNLTVMADGGVLATGGLSSTADLVDLDPASWALAAESWNPETGDWTTLAAESVTRQYHSSAMLLPDGRLISAGGGLCGACNQQGYLEKNAQVFTPPYLYKQDGSGELAPRPEIESAPDQVAYDSELSVCTADAESIGKVALVRLGSVTHSVNMEQRYVPLDFTGEGQEVSATSPLNANIAPPGYYMLFVIDDDGVPSVAKMVRVGSGSPETPACSSSTTGPGPDPQPDPSPQPDVQPPNTEITKVSAVRSAGKERSAARKLSFRFSSTEPGSTFECKVGKRAFASCESPKMVAMSKRTKGQRFLVRAIDPAGNVDPSPASRRVMMSRR